MTDIPKVNCLTQAQKRSVIIIELIWQAKTQGESIFFFFLEVSAHSNHCYWENQIAGHCFPMFFYGRPDLLGPRLQFLWLPLDVNSLEIVLCFSFEK